MCFVSRVTYLPKTWHLPEYMSEVMQMKAQIKGQVSGWCVLYMEDFNTEERNKCLQQSVEMNSANWALRMCLKFIPTLYRRLLVKKNMSLLPLEGQEELELYSQCKTHSCHNDKHNVQDIFKKDK